MPQRQSGGGGAGGAAGPPRPQPGGRGGGRDPARPARPRPRRGGGPAGPAAGAHRPPAGTDGEVLADVPDLGRGAVAEMARRGRAAQRAWEALGFGGRGRVLRRAQRWLTENSDRVVETIVSETGKAWEDAHAPEVGYGA